MNPMYFSTKRKLSLFVLILLLAVLAFAHAVPGTMVPAANATVSAPASVTVHFSEELEPKFSKLSLSDAAGKVVSKAPSAVGTDAKVMTLPLPALDPGVYTVNWTSVALDSGVETGANISSRSSRLRYYLRSAVASAKSGRPASDR